MITTKAQLKRALISYYAGSSISNERLLERVQDMWDATVPLLAARGAISFNEIMSDYHAG